MLLNDPNIFCQNVLSGDLACVKQCYDVEFHGRPILLVGGMLQATFCPMALPGSGHTGPFRPSHHSGYQHVLIHGALLSHRGTISSTFSIFKILRR